MPVLAHIILASGVCQGFVLASHRLSTDDGDHEIAKRLGHAMQLLPYASRKATVGRAAVVSTLFLSAVVLHAPATAVAPPAAPGPVFEKDVLPILQTKCHSCHGEKKQKAGLDLRDSSTILRGGENGPAIVLGSAEKSLMWSKVHQDKNKMPPGKDKLSTMEKATVRAWIDRGAVAVAKGTSPANMIPDRQVTDEDRRFWAF
jgi:hypothetical protein